MAKQRKLQREQAAATDNVNVPAAPLLPQRQH
jgi:hypothetical protein